MLLGLLSSCGSGGGGSYGGPPPPSPSFAVQVSPNALNLTAGGAGQATLVSIIAANGFTGNVTVSAPVLPAGLNAAPAFPLTIAAGSSQSVTFTASGSASTGGTTITLTGTNGSLNATAMLTLQVQGLPQTFSLSVSPNSATIVQGGSSPPIMLNVMPLNGFIANVTLTASGLPSGVTTTPSLPQTQSPPVLENIALTAAANSTAGTSTVTIQATGGGVTKSVMFMLTIQPPSTAPAARINFLRIDSTPASDTFILDEPEHKLIAYDAAHKQIFVANRALNRIEVLSSTDGHRIGIISAPLPSSLDLSPDGTRVWVGTAVEEILGIDPATLQVVERLPISGVTISNTRYNVPEGVVPLSNGKALLHLHWSGTTGSIVALWDPTANTFTNVTPTGFGPGAGYMARSGDYSKVLVGSIDTSGEVALYDTASSSFAKQVAFPGVIPTLAAANPTGTQFAVFLFFTGVPPQVVVLDSSLNTLATFATGLVGGLVYSRDGKYLMYSNQVAQIGAAPVISVVDTQTLKLVGLAPDLGSSKLEDVDETYRLFGILNQGVDYLDASNPTSLPTGAPAISQQLPSVVPEQGSPTASTPTMILGNTFESTAKVFFGSQAATNVGVVNPNQINATAPPASPGPVNVSAFFPSGWASLSPDAFSYGPFLLVLSATAGRPEGGDTLNIFGYGFGPPSTPPIVTLGGHPATVTQVLTTQQTLSQLLFPPPFPVQQMTIRTPPGSPGAADLVITTPSGASTVPGAFRYLASDAIFASPAPLRFITYDRKRQRLYATASDRIEVFDLGTNQFLAAIIPPGGPFANSDLRQVILAPDGSTLVVADFGRSAVYLFNPDVPSNVTSVSVPAAVSGSGPARLAATSTAKIFLGLTFPGSGFCNCLDVLDLATHSVTTGPVSTTELPLLAGDAAGDRVFLSLGDSSGGEMFLWDATSQTFQTTSATTTFSFEDAAAAGDGNFYTTGGGGIGIQQNPIGVNANLRYVTQPVYQTLQQSGPAGFEPGEQIHPSGSLLYQPIFSGIDIFDAGQGIVRERVLLPEAVTQGRDGTTNSVLALDEFGRRMFVLTKSGITIAQLGVVPLSIGSITPANGSAGGGVPITIRGSGFEPGAVVGFGGAQPLVTVVDSNTITLTTPALPAGPVRVTVTNPDGQSWSLEAGFIAN